MTTLKEPPVKSDLLPASPAPGTRTSEHSHLQNEIVGGVLTVTFLVLVAILVWGFVWQREVLQAAALERLTGVAAAQSERVDEFLAEGSSHAEMLASRSPIIRGLSGGEGGTEAAGVQRAIIR